MTQSEPRDLIPVQPCEHPEIMRWQDMATHEAIFFCKACGRKIGIPLRTYTTHTTEDIEGIIGEVFGPRWQEKARQERVASGVSRYW